MMKRLKSKMPSSKIDLSRINPNWYLLIGIFAMTLSHLSFSVALIGWVSMVPFLIYLFITDGWKSRLLFFLALVIAWSIIVLKIITPPIPYGLVFLYSIPISLVHLPGYLLWAHFKDRKFSTLLFPAIMVVLEWIQYTFTPLASWGVAAYTQANSIVIMQSLSIFGIAGLGFLIYWVNLGITYYLLNKGMSPSKFILPLSILCIVIIFGSLRFEKGNSKRVETITVSAVGTDSDIGGLPLPPDSKNISDIEAIIQRTIKAAEFGAKIVVWTEAAFYLESVNEPKWTETFQQLAKESNVTLVASYIHLLSESPMRYENKFLLISSDGNIIHTYLKHQPVPGEPAVKGTAPLKIFNVEGARLGAAICYDYDFPYLAKEYGNLKADVVALPSSDWRGIDPLHTRMAAFRAVEQGHSIVRSTRFGLSAAIDPYGEINAQMSSFDDNPKIMIAQLPMKGIKTVYSIIGDIFVYLCIAFIPIFIFANRSISK
jgi:apolipoprotein N-acyltransferase